MRPILSNLEDLKAFLGGHKLALDTRKSQNFLICQEVVEAFVMGVGNGPKMLTELGAGTGTLTQALLAAGYKVKAIEKDKELAKALPKALTPKERDNLDLVLGDLRKVDWKIQSSNDKFQKYQLVGNIPYHLSGLVIRRMTQLKPAPERVILLTQKEVGDRMCAESGDMSLLSLAVGLWGKPEKLLTIPASCFWPQPEVDSQLTMIIPNEDILDRQEDNERVLDIARPFFQGKRKQIGGQMSKAFDLDADKVSEILKSVGLRRDMRPQELSAENWREVTKFLQK